MCLCVCIIDVCMHVCMYVYIHTFNKKMTLYYLHFFYFALSLHYNNKNFGEFSRISGLDLLIVKSLAKQD